MAQRKTFKTEKSIPASNAWRDMKIEAVDIGRGVTIDIASFAVPMYHEDWHKAEGMGLKFVRHSPPDDYPYPFDDVMIFVAPKDEHVFTEYFGKG